MNWWRLRLSGKLKLWQIFNLIFTRLIECFVNLGFFLSLWDCMCWFILSLCIYCMGAISKPCWGELERCTLWLDSRYICCIPFHHHPVRVDALIVISLLTIYITRFMIFQCSFIFYMFVSHIYWEVNFIACGIPSCWLDCYSWASGILVPCFQLSAPSPSYASWVLYVFSYFSINRFFF